MENFLFYEEEFLDNIKFLKEYINNKKYKTPGNLFF